MKFLNSRYRKILIWVWIICSAITFLTGGGFATRYVLESAEDEFIRYKEELGSFESIEVLKMEDGQIVSVCFNALLAYTLEFSTYQIDKFFESNFKNRAIHTVSREEIKAGCNNNEGATDLLADARSNKTNSLQPYYKLNGPYCAPGKIGSRLRLGCFINPKHKWAKIEIFLEKPEFKYIDNSSQLLWLPIAWIADVILAPVFVIFFVSYFLLWITGGGVPGMP